MKDIEKILAKASGGNFEVPEQWMSATGFRSLAKGDPGLLWLEYHGDDEGFERDSTAYEFLPMISVRLIPSRSSRGRLE